MSAEVVGCVTRDRAVHFGADYGEGVDHVPPSRPDEETLSRTVGNAAKVREAFDALPMLAIALEGPRLLTTATSQVFRASLGRSELIGVPVHEAFAEMAEQQILDLYDQVYATRQPAERREYRVQVQAEDGALIETFLDFVLAPMRAPDGTVTGGDRYRYRCDRRGAGASGRRAAGGRGAAPLRRGPRCHPCPAA